MTELDLKLNFDDVNSDNERLYDDKFPHEVCINFCNGSSSRSQALDTN